MVLSFFTGLVIILIIVGIITAIFDYEQKRCNRYFYKETEKYKNAINKVAKIMYVILYITIIIFSICNIVIFIYGIATKNTFFIIVSIMFAITMIFYALSNYTDKFSSITIVIFSIATVLYVLSMVFFFIYQIMGMQNLKTDVIKVNTINIIELQTVPYTNISGTRYYIRSEPSLAYYYDIITQSGGRTTKVIDVYNNYVEKFEDDIYKENPHIDVWEVVQKYTNGYGKEGENVKGYQYYIYIPEGGTYYIDKE